MELQEFQVNLNALGAYIIAGCFSFTLLVFWPLVSLDFKIPGNNQPSNNLNKTTNE